MKLEASQRLKASTKVCGCVTASCDHDVEAELTEKQKQLDIDGDGEIDSEDLQRLRKGEKPESVEAATAKEAAKFVTLTFAKNGLKAKFSRNNSDQNLLVFNMVALGGEKFMFGLHLEGKTVSLDTLGHDAFDPTNFLSDALSKVNTKYIDFEKLGSAAFAKWEASTDDMAEQIGDALTRYKSFVERFNSAISDITAEMAKNKK